MENTTLFDEPFPMPDLLNLLIKGTETLLYKKDYDGPDYEEMNYAVKRMKEYIPELQEDFGSRFIEWCREKENNQKNNPIGINRKVTTSHSIKDLEGNNCCQECGSDNTNGSGDPNGGICNACGYEW